MPDVHAGKGATIGSVIPTQKAIIPAAVGVDIGCGMIAQKTSLKAKDLPESLKELRTKIEKAVPHGMNRTRGGRDSGSWGHVPDDVALNWKSLEDGFKKICSKHKVVKDTNNIVHLGTLGTGNHFIEVCLDTEDSVWVMLHSGSRGVGNRIGRHFIELAKKEMEKWMIHLPHADLSYLPEGSEYFKDYVEAVHWAQEFARINRQVMMKRTLKALTETDGIPPFTLEEAAVNCHHNYVSIENHFGENVYLTRKGAVRAGKGDLGIIPGSMGARSFIVRGLGNEDSFCSCSHGAGRIMSRMEAKRRFTVKDHEYATQGVECRKDPQVIDETPKAYKPIEKVMEAQSDLVEIVHTLKQIVCVKG